jgi:hypothetical protein
MMTVSAVVSNLSSGNSILSRNIDSLIGGSRVLATSIDNFKEGDVQGAFGASMLFEDVSPKPEDSSDTPNQGRSHLRATKIEVGREEASFHEQAALLRTGTKGLLSGGSICGLDTSSVDAFINPPKEVKELIQVTLGVGKSL